MTVDDCYTDLVRDYEWLFGDDAPGARVLDSACGIGADALALARRGFDVTASDGSASMVEQARRRCARSGVPIEVTQSTWQDLPRRVPGPFDLVLCLGNAIVHAATRPAMIASLQGLKQVLSPGGVLVIDSRNWEHLYRSRPRIVPGRRVIERRGIRSCSLYIWTIPEADLPAVLHAAGLTVVGDSYQPENPFYAVAAAAA